MFEDLKFSPDFSVEDWNILVKLKFEKYFTNQIAFDKNRELLRTEIINYIRFCEKSEYLELFEWLCALFGDCVQTNKEEAIRIFADTFKEISDTDTRWMTNVLIQPDLTENSERDKISFYFKFIDETLEGALKPRFKLLDNLSRLKLGHVIVNNSSFDFGKLIRDFPTEYSNTISLLLKDPYFSISSNQWRNIAAHKSYVINKDSITINYGRSTNISLTITYDDFYNVVNWTQDIYKVLRLAQVLIHLNNIDDIVKRLGGTVGLNVRFESSLLHLIHNIQVVGFEFVSTEEHDKTFILNVKGKIGFETNSSLIHASQCLVPLSCAIYDDSFVKDNFENTQVNIVDEKKNILAAARIPICIALKYTNGEINLDEYLSNMIFQTKTTPNTTQTTCA